MKFQSRFFDCQRFISPHNGNRDVTVSSSSVKLSAFALPESVTQLVRTPGIRRSCPESQPATNTLLSLSYKCPNLAFFNTTDLSLLSIKFQQ
jgi:hypothetical protein